MPAQAVPPFVLASGSSGRLGLLRRAGIDPEVVVSGVDETTEAGLGTSSVVAVLAERKAEVVASQRPDALVLGCDSLLELDGISFGKPETADEAAHRWRTLSGREGTLLTGHCLITPGHARLVRAVASTTVRFGTPTDAEVSAYVASGEPVRVAGAFTIDGLGAPFIDGIDGDPGNVVGLSLPLLRRMLADVGVRITDLWRRRSRSDR
jgi:septum formation protein